MNETESSAVIAPCKRNWTDYSSEYNAAFRTGLTIQGVLAVTTAFFLDSGAAHRAFWIAFLCQWATVWIILFRRPLTPTRIDLAIVRYEILPLLFVIASYGRWFLQVIGVAS